MKDDTRVKLELEAAKNNRFALFRLSCFDAYPDDKTRRLNNLKRSAELGYSGAKYILACLYEGSVEEYKEEKDITKSIEILNDLIENENHHEAEYFLYVAKYIEGSFDTEIDIIKGLEIAIEMSDKNRVCECFVRDIRAKNIEELCDIYSEEVAESIYLRLH